LLQSCRARAGWFAWSIATGFAYKHYDDISIIHVGRTRAGLKLERGSGNGD